MQKAFTSVIGLDLGRHAWKAVHLQKKGSSPVALTAFATRVVGESNTGAMPVDALAHHLKLLLRDLGSSAKACAVALSSPESILRIIEQPATPPHFLRDALRLNGLVLLNQDCRDFVLDCDQIVSASEEGEEASNGLATRKQRYLVGGLPRIHVNRVHEALTKSRTPMTCLQLAPISNFNAFEHSIQGKTDRLDEAFLLADIGHEETRVLAGCGRELVLVRSVDYGGRHFVDAVSSEGAIDRESAITLIEQGDAGMAEAGYHSLAILARELRNSIGFFEGLREQTISRVYFSGALVKAELPLQILCDELEMPCDTWDPFACCQINLPKNKMALFDAERCHLNVACGAALQLF